MVVPLASAEDMSLTRVIDGDTVEVVQGSAVETIRLLGVDTPERGQHARCWIERLMAEANPFAHGFHGAMVKARLTTGKVRIA